MGYFLNKQSHNPGAMLKFYEGIFLLFYFLPKRPPLYLLSLINLVYVAHSHSADSRRSVLPQIHKIFMLMYNLCSRSSHIKHPQSLYSQCVHWLTESRGDQRILKIIFRKLWCRKCSFLFARRKGEKRGEMWWHETVSREAGWLAGAGQEIRWRGDEKRLAEHEKMNQGQRKK